LWIEPFKLRGSRPKKGRHSAPIMVFSSLGIELSYGARRHVVARSRYSVRDASALP